MNYFIENFKVSYTFLHNIYNYLLIRKLTSVDIFIIRIHLYINIAFILKMTDFRPLPVACPAER